MLITVAEVAIAVAMAVVVLLLFMFMALFILIRHKTPMNSHCNIRFGQMNKTIQSTVRTMA